MDIKLIKRVMYVNRRQNIFKFENILIEVLPSKSLLKEIFKRCIVIVISMSLEYRFNVILISSKPNYPTIFRIMRITRIIGIIGII